jgi:hypothetical protein
MVINYESGVAYEEADQYYFTVTMPAHTWNKVMDTMKTSVTIAKPRSGQRVHSDYAIQFFNIHKKKYTPALLEH